MSHPVAHNHHFIPQFLLRNFLGADGKVWVYDTEVKTIESRGTKGAGSVEDLYAWSKADGSTDFQTIENYFGQTVESDAARAIRKLLEHKELSTKEALHFFRFVAAQHCRTPAFFSRVSETMAPVMQEMYERIAKFDAAFRERLTKTLAESGSTPEEIDQLFETMGNGGMVVKPGREFVMQQALRMIDDLAHHFSSMRWCFFEVLAGEPDLIIGDHPITLFDADPTSDGTQPFGILSPLVEIMLPLSSRMAACGRWTGPVSYGSLEVGAVAVANARTMRGAQRYIYASHRSEELLRHAVVERANAPRVRITRIEDGEKLAIIATHS